MTQHEERRAEGASAVAEGCRECPMASSRRAFLRDIGMAVGAVLAAGAIGPTLALAEGVSEIAPARSSGAQRTYAVPATDSVSVDAANDVIVARWNNRVYAFSLRCPHRGTRLEWLDDERRIFCPKHEARFRPDGSHDSGRRTRDLDRYDITLQGQSTIVVDLNALHRANEEPQAWQNAVVQLR
jgi:nitrite reductase/ring-hydroxylating ferredoxin subunit